MKLSDMKIIITGAGGGMGAHFATRIAEAGGQVAVCDIKEEGLKELAESCSDLPGTVHYKVCDVSDEASIGSFVDWAFDAMGGLNGLVNNAGLLRDGLLVKKDRKTGEIIKMSKEQWQQVIDVNLTGVFLCGREAAAKMLELGTEEGVIVNISSLARHGSFGQSNYSAAKSAVAAMAEVWAKELARYNIRTGAVAPGTINTDMLAAMKPEARERLVQAVPLRRLGEAEHIARSVAFIFETDYFTGRCIDMDGGLR